MTLSKLLQLAEPQPPVLYSADGNIYLVGLPEDGTVSATYTQGLAPSGAVITLGSAISHPSFSLDVGLSRSQSAFILHLVLL